MRCPKVVPLSPHVYTFISRLLVHMALIIAVEICFYFVYVTRVETGEYLVQVQNTARIALSTAVNEVQNTPGGPKFLDQLRSVILDKDTRHSVLARLHAEYRDLLATAQEDKSGLLDSALMKEIGSVLNFVDYAQDVYEHHNSTSIRPRNALEKLLEKIVDSKTTDAEHGKSERVMFNWRLTMHTIQCTLGFLLLVFGWVTLIPLVAYPPQATSHYRRQETGETGETGETAVRRESNGTVYKLDWKRILVDNIVLMLMLGIFEFLFFVRVVQHFRIASDGETIKALLESTREELLRSTTII
eukprot:Platyproteum_vivax@DN7311_c2_g1_i2.p2